MNKNLKSVITEIQKGLSSHDAEIRKKSILMLSRIDAPEVIEVLLPLKDDSSEEIRRISSKIIGILTQKYNQKAPLVSLRQKEEIKAEIESSGFDIKKLVHYLSSGSRENKIAAITAFYGVKDLSVLKIFKDRLGSEKDAAVIATYVKAIGASGGADEINFLINYAGHDDNRVKSNAIEALCMLGANYEVFEEMLPLIANSDERVKISAFQYFAGIGKDVMVSKVDSILSGNDDDLKILAIKLTFFYEPSIFINLYRKHFEGLNNAFKSLIIKKLKESTEPAACQFVDKYDAVGFDGDFIDSSFLDDKTGRDIFDIANGIKNDEEFFFDEGMILFDIGNFERAIVEFNRSTRINPSYLRAWKQKASAYTQLENFKKALECIEKVLELNPGDDDAIYNKALILQQSGDDIGAAKCFEATNKVKFSSSVFTRPGNKKSGNRGIEDAIDRLIDESASAPGAAGGGANVAIDRLIDEISDGIGVQSAPAAASGVVFQAASDKPPARRKKTKAPPSASVDNTLRNSIIGLIVFAVMVFALIGLYYRASNDELNTVSLIRHFQKNGINGEQVYLERFTYMDEAIVERVDYKGVAFSIRILKVKTPAKAESIRNSRDEGRHWHLNKNFLIAIDRGEAEKILSAFKSFR